MADQKLSSLTSTVPVATDEVYFIRNVSGTYSSLRATVRDLPVRESIIVAVGDEGSAITSGVAKVTFRMPYAFTVLEVRGSLTVAQATGALLTVDVNEGGTSIISTKLTFDNTEKTTKTAAALPVISDASLADDAEMTIDVDAVGDGTAKGLKVTLIGVRT